jgi:hypothetical protein
VEARYGQLSVNRDHQYEPDKAPFVTGVQEFIVKDPRSVNGIEVKSTQDC